MGVEGGFEAAHEGEVGARWSPNADGALESGWAPRERSGGAFRGAERKDVRGGFAEALEERWIARVREKSKVEYPAGPGESGMRKRSTVGEDLQLLEKCGEASGESGDFENGRGLRSFEEDRNRLANVVPEVGSFGFVESNEL